MDRFKNNIENVIFSNKTQFIKNRRQGSNNSSNLESNWLSNWLSYFTFDGILLWIPLFIMVVIISYLTVMTAKYMTTECSNKRS